MARNFLQYWKPAQVDREIFIEEPLVHSGSGQFEKMQIVPGDVVWIVTVRPLGEFVLVGRIQVGECISYQEAVMRFGDNVWESDDHIVAEPGTEKDLREISLMDIAGQLRFQSSSNDRLTISNGYVKAQQLQSMRKLDPTSVPLLEAKWYGAGLPGEGELEQQISKSGAGYGNPETNRKVERAAVEHVTRWYESRGWKVQSVEAKSADMTCSVKNGVGKSTSKSRAFKGQDCRLSLPQGN
jgi:hypothetical protein